MIRLCQLRIVCLASLAGRAAAPLAAQVPDGALAITAADITRHMQVIAADSMRGRNTPSPGLEATARYVAGQFEQLGLRPFSELTTRVKALGQAVRTVSSISTWYQRYSVPLDVDFDRSAIVFTAGQRRAAASLATAAYFNARLLPLAPPTSGTVLLAGTHTLQGLQTLDLKGKTVLYVPPRALTDSMQEVVAQQLAGRSAALVVMRSSDSIGFAARVLTGRHRIVRRSSESQWGVQVRPGAVPGLSDVFAAAGVDLDSLSADSTPVFRELPKLKIAADVQLVQASPDSATAPNVIGLLEGTDSTLKDQFVVVSAHMDYGGVDRNRPDSIRNGVYDNASGTAALITLAKALSRPGSRPRRSVLFVATSGGAKPAFWGARAFILGMTMLVSPNAFNPEPPRGILPIIADVNLDMLGGPTSDTVAVDGMRSLALSPSIDWTAAAHPELGLTVVEGEPAFAPVADHSVFSNSELRLPGMSFHTGRHADTGPGPELAVPVDAERVARVARLVFYVSQQMLNVDQRPVRSEEFRRQLARLGDSR